VLAPWLAWAVLRTFGLEGLGPLVQLVTFTPYVGLSAPVPLLLALVLRRWAVAVLAAAVVVAFALALLPRASAGPNATVPDGAALRVMTANLYFGRGDPKTVVALVRTHRVDVLALEEVTPQELARLDAAGLRRLLPHRAGTTLPGAAGTMLLSRRPLGPPTATTGRPDPGGLRRRLLVPGAAPLDVGAVHPPPPLGGRAGEWRQILRAIPLPDRASRTLSLVMGDFNATLDHHELRRLLGDGGYVDAADATGEGYRTTWPAGRRFPPEIAIDHVLVDPRIAVRAISVHTVPRSDHRAVIATLALPRAG
jgi:endonuclease/exonuclease/phosphatase family metal-dependent hydrolase